MYIAVRHLVGISSILLLGLNLNADFVGENDSFEGILRYELKTGARVWTLEHQVKAGKTCTDIYLNDLKFQSVLSTDDGQFLIDVLGKRILPLGGRGADMGPRGMGRDERMPPMADNVPPPLEMKARMDMMLEDAEAPSGEGNAFGKTTLKFNFKAEKRKTEMEGITGYGSFPSVVFQQFEDLKEVGPQIAATLRKYALIPVCLEVEARKKQNAVSLRMLSVDPCEVADETFDLPSEYSMKMGGPGGSAGGRRGGPPPGGGNGGGRKGPPPGGGPGGL